MPLINQADSNKVRTSVPARMFHKSAYHRNLTTGAFMQIQPLFYKELIPREKFDGRYQIWSRLNPLVNPTMGIMNYHYHRFFVRYKDVFPAWDDFYNRSLHVGSSATGGVTQGFVPFSPYISMKYMYDLLREANLIYSAGSSDEYDFSWKPLSGSVVYYNWTPGPGVAAFKALTNLGYRFSWCEVDNRKISLLPLMCFGKVIIDHFWPKQYVNNSVYTAIRAMFEINAVNYSANNADSQLFKGIKALLTHLYCFYDNDGFYQGWDNPAGPSVNQTTSPSFNDGIIFDGSDSNDIYLEENNSALLFNSQGDAINRLTKYGLTALAKLSAWMKRYQLAGSSAIDRYLARFGIVVKDMHRSIKLGSDVIEVRVGDVESNSDSSITVGAEQFTSVLGDLAGKGVGANTAALKYNNGDHFGIYLGILTIIPDAGLYQGMDRNNYHVEPEHFWTPEIDGFGPAAVDVSEVYQSKRGEINAYRAPGSNQDFPFCFLPNQYEGCVGRNILSGAFALPSQGSEQLKSWHLYRDLEEFFQENYGDFVHGLDFMSGETDRIQYSRVFYNGKNEENFIIRFRSVYDFDSFKKPLSENYEWEDGGKEVSVDGNSVELN